MKRDSQLLFTSIKLCMLFRLSLVNFFHYYHCFYRARKWTNPVAASARKFRACRGMRGNIQLAL